jgi:hypothetical protein
MTCSAITNVSLPPTVPEAGDLTSIAFDPGARLEHLFEQASKALGFQLNQTHSCKEIEDRLLAKLMGCSADTRYQKASLLLPFERGICGDEPDKTIDAVRNLLDGICKEEKLSSKDSFTKSLNAQMEDLARIDECLQTHWNLPRPDGPENKKEIVVIGRELLDLQRKFADSHYLFSHGMSRIHAFLPKLITELDRRLWPKRESKDFIFVRVVPPTQRMTHIREIFQRIGAWIMGSQRRVSDHDLRKELLSVDADLLNREAGESALDFYLSNRNMFHKIHVLVCDILTTFSKQFGFEYSETKCKEDLGSGIAKALGGEDDLGTALRELRYDVGRGALLAYAVPKTLVHNPETNFIYTSYPGGGHINRDDPLAGLEGLIEGKWRNQGLSVRLLTSHLRPEKGIKAFWVEEKKEQDPHYLKWEERFNETATSFFNKVFQHCQMQSAWIYWWPQLGTRNAECERLLSETSTGTKRRGA